MTKFALQTLQNPPKLRHKDLSPLGYWQDLPSALSYIKYGHLSPLEASKKAFVHPNSQLDLIKLAAELPAPPLPNLFLENGVDNQKILKRLGRLACRKQRIEAEETERSLSHVGFASRSLFLSPNYLEVEKIKSQHVEKYKKRNKIKGRTQEQNASEIIAFCAGIAEYAYSNKHHCYYITLNYDPAFHFSDVQSGLIYLKEMKKKIIRFAGSYGYCSIEPHNDGDGHLHICIFIPADKEEKFKEHFHSIFKDCQNVIRKKKRHFRFTKIDQNLDEYETVINYVTKSATYKHKKYNKWKKLHGLHSVNQFGFKGSTALWRLARRFSDKDIEKLRESPFKSLIYSSRTSDAYSFLKEFKEKNIKPWALNFKFIDANKETKYEKLETIAFSSCDFDFLAISYETPRPFPILCENLSEVIELLKNRKILTKNKLFGQISEYTYQKLKISRLVLKSYSTSIDIRHPLCFLPENSFSPVQIKQLLEQNAQDLINFKAKKLKEEQERAKLQQIERNQLELSIYEKYLREKYYGHDLDRLLKRIKAAKNAYDFVKLAKLELRFQSLTQECSFWFAWSMKNKKTELGLH